MILPFTFFQFFTCQKPFVAILSSSIILYNANPKKRLRNQCMPKRPCSLDYQKSLLSDDLKAVVLHDDKDMKNFYLDLESNLKEDLRVVQESYLKF